MGTLRLTWTRRWWEEATSAHLARNPESCSHTSTVWATLTSPYIAIKPRTPSLNLCQIPEKGISDEAAVIGRSHELANRGYARPVASRGAHRRVLQPSRSSRPSSHIASAAIARMAKRNIRLSKLEKSGHRLSKFVDVYVRIARAFVAYHIPGAKPRIALGDQGLCN